MDNPTVPSPAPEPVLTSNQVEVVETKPKSYSILLISIALLSLILLGSTAFLYYQNMQLKNTIASYQTPIALPESTVQAGTPTSDPTANWKIYTNSQAGFELRYPMDKFKLMENPTKLVSMVLPSQSENWLYIDISTDKLTEPVTIEDWVTNNWPNQDKAARKDIKIDGVSAVIFDGGNTEPKSNKYMFVIKGNNIIQISAHYLNFLTNQGGGKNPYYDQTKDLWINDVDQILSTFKFTN